jgi:hypothetical protein
MYWYKYWYFDFGPVNVSDGGFFQTQYDDMSMLKTDLWGRSSFASEIAVCCPSICSNIKDIKEAGESATILSIFYVIFAVFTVLISLSALICSGPWFPKLRKTILVLLVIGGAVCLIFSSAAFSTFVDNSNFGSFTDTEQQCVVMDDDGGNDTPDDPETRAGHTLGIVLISWNAAAFLWAGIVAVLYWRR